MIKIFAYTKSIVSSFENRVYELLIVTILIIFTRQVSCYLMRFLLIILSIIWLLFAWAAFEAIRWHPPLQPPEHAQEALQQYNPKHSAKERDELLYILSIDDISDTSKARAHFQLAYIYWVETYIKNSRAEQMLMLNKSLDHCLTALSIAPDNPSYVYSVADLYHQMKKYKLAEDYYKKAIHLDPSFARAKLRYEELKKEMQ